MAIGLVAVVAVAAAGAFALGRASSDDGASPVPSRAALSHVSVTTTTLPGVNVDEIVESRPDQPLDPATRTTLAAQLVVARSAATQYPTVASARARACSRRADSTPSWARTSSRT